MVGILLLSLLAGCSPAVGGVGAVRLDGGQGLVGVFGLCKGFGKLSAITVYEAMDDGGVGVTVIDLERVGPAPTERVVEVPLLSAPQAWRARKATADLDPEQLHELRAWSKDGNTRVSSFPFRISELKDRVDPAKTVLIKDYTGNTDGIERYEATFSTPEGFAAIVGQRCDAG